jgi:hypothetical protein
MADNVALTDKGSIKPAVWFALEAFHPRLFPIVEILRHQFLERMSKHSVPPDRQIATSSLRSIPPCRYQQYVFAGFD